MTRRAARPSSLLDDLDSMRDSHSSIWARLSPPAMPLSASVSQAGAGLHASAPPPPPPNRQRYAGLGQGVLAHALLLLGEPGVGSCSGRGFLASRPPAVGLARSRLRKLSAAAACSCSAPPLLLALSHVTEVSSWSAGAGWRGRCGACDAPAREGCITSELYLQAQRQAAAQELATLIASRSSQARPRAPQASERAAARRTASARGDSGAPSIASAHPSLSNTMGACGVSGGPGAPQGVGNEAGRSLAGFGLRVLLLCTLAV